MSVRSSLSNPSVISSSKQSKADIYIPSAPSTGLTKGELMHVTCSVCMHCKDGKYGAKVVDCTHAMACEFDFFKFLHLL